MNQKMRDAAALCLRGTGVAFILTILALAGMLAVHV